jgi:hypothetical protein
MQGSDGGGHSLGASVPSRRRNRRPGSEFRQALRHVTVDRRVVPQRRAGQQECRRRVVRGETILWVRGPFPASASLGYEPSMTGVFLAGDKLCLCWIEQHLQSGSCGRAVFLDASVASSLRSGRMPAVGGSHRWLWRGPIRAWA